MQYQQLRLPSIDYEYKLSTAQRIQFLKVRDQELEKLTKDIFELRLSFEVANWESDEDSQKYN